MSNLCRQTIHRINIQSGKLSNTIIFYIFSFFIVLKRLHGKLKLILITPNKDGRVQFFDRRFYNEIQFRGNLIVLLENLN